MSDDFVVEVTSDAACVVYLISPLLKMKEDYAYYGSLRRHIIDLLLQQVTYGTIHFCIGCKRIRIGSWTYLLTFDFLLGNKLRR